MSFNSNLDKHYWKCHNIQTTVGLAVSAVAPWFRGAVFEPCWSHIFSGNNNFFPWNGLGRDHCQLFLYERITKQKILFSFFPVLQQNMIGNICFKIFETYILSWQFRNIYIVWWHCSLLIIKYSLLALIYIMYRFY